MLRPFLRNFWLLKPTLRSPSSAFQWYPITCDLVWPLNVIGGVLVWLWRQMRRRRQGRLPCLAYINIPLSTYCKIRHVSIFTAASRGSPWNSTACSELGQWLTSYIKESEINGHTDTIPTKYYHNVVHYRTGHYGNWWLASADDDDNNDDCVISGHVSW